MHKPNKDNAGLTTGNVCNGESSLENSQDLRAEEL